MDCIVRQLEGAEGYDGIVRVRDRALCKGAEAMKGARRITTKREMEGHDVVWTRGGGRVPGRSLVVLGLDK